MTEQVLVCVKGRQTIDGETQEAPELITTGTYSRDALAHRLVYEEVLGENGETTENELLFTESKAELKKEGEVQAHLIFEEGKKNLSYYQTPYGQISIEMVTNAVEIDLQEEEINVHLDYAMTMNEQMHTEFDLGICIRAKES